MPDAVKTSESGKVDKKVLKNQIEQFVHHHQKKQQLLIKDGRRRNLTLEELIQRSPQLPDDAVEGLFRDGLQEEVSQQVISEVYAALKTMQRRVNALDPRRRFYVLETINFFSSKIGIGKLIPALVTLSGNEQKRAICEFIFPTFFSIQKNIETLVSCNEIYNAETIHIDRGGLYVFVSDITRIITRLFREEFMSRITAGVSTMQFLSGGFDPSTFRLKEGFRAESEYAYEEMIDDEDQMRKIVLEFIQAIQSHENLYHYSLKRDLYYKQFLMDATQKDRFKGLDAIDVSRVLAGCLMANEQMQPPDELITGMIDEATFDSDDVRALKREFLNGLSPKIIYRLIGRFRVSLQHISKANFGNEFQEIQKFSVKTILKNVWAGFISLVEKGIIITTGPFVLAFTQVKRAFEVFVEEEGIRDEAVTSAMLDGTGLVAAKDLFKSKNLEAFSQMTQSFQLVETDIISFTGEHEGATYKDFGYNTRVFRNDEKLMVQFLSVFRLLFKRLVTDAKVLEITYASHQKIREYYAAYQFDRYLMCLGLTHIKNPKLPVIEEKSIFPYIILFAESKTRKEGKALSRTIKKDEQNRIFNEIGFSSKTAKIYYEALYLVLHLLPGEDWEKQSAQMCIAFLTRELNRMLQKKEKLLYIESPL